MTRNRNRRHDNHGNGNGHGTDSVDIERMLQVLLAAGIEARTNAVVALGARLATETDPTALAAIQKSMVELTVPLDVLEKVKLAAEKALQIYEVRARILGLIRRMEGNDHNHQTHDDLIDPHSDHDGRYGRTRRHSGRTNNGHGH